MTAVSRSRTVLVTLVAGAVLLIGGTVGLAATVAGGLGAPVTATGLPEIKLGTTFPQLHESGHVGRLARGCSLDPGSRAARIKGRVQGTVEFTEANPHRAADIYITGGANARGVGIGAGLAAIRHAFTGVTVSHATDKTFQQTLVSVRLKATARLQFTISTQTGRVSAIGVPYIPFCD